MRAACRGAVPPLSPSERAALTARERILDIRRVMAMVRRLREPRGTLTLAQIQQTRRLLADRAEELYRRAQPAYGKSATPTDARRLRVAERLD